MQFKCSTAYTFFQKVCYTWERYNLCSKKAMSGVPNLNIAESVEELKSLLKQQVTS
jgi:hypothetical protein